MNALRITTLTFFFSLIVSNSFAIIKDSKKLEQYFAGCMGNMDFDIGGQFEFCGCGANLLYQKLEDEDFVKIQTGSDEEKMRIVNIIRTSVEICRKKVEGNQYNP